MQQKKYFKIKLIIDKNEKNKCNFGNYPVADRMHR